MRQEAISEGLRRVIFLVGRIFVFVLIDGGIYLISSLFNRLIGCRVSSSIFRRSVSGYISTGLEFMVIHVRDVK